MQVSTTNDVKIYNLSAGKSLPEWLTERKRRQLVKNDIDIRKRIELIQVIIFIKVQSGVCTSFFIAIINVCLGF